MWRVIKPAFATMEVLQYQIREFRLRIKDVKATLRQVDQEHLVKWQQERSTTDDDVNIEDLAERFGYKPIPEFVLDYMIDQRVMRSLR